MVSTCKIDNNEARLKGVGHSSASGSQAYTVTAFVGMDIAGGGILVLQLGYISFKIRTMPTFEENTLVDLPSQGNR